MIINHHFVWLFIKIIFILNFMGIYSAYGADPAPQPKTEVPNIPPCPPSMTAYRGKDIALECLCSGQQTQSGSIWGTDVYTDDSHVCRAARHAGMIGSTGGQVSLQTAPGAQSYQGSFKNKIQSSNYGRWSGSFIFLGGTSNPNVMTIDTCPADIKAYRGQDIRIECFCDTDQTKGGPLWGTDLYTDDSSVCRAALHAGMISAKGGDVEIIVAPGAQAYSGTKRFGIQSSSYGPWHGSFHFAGAKTQQALADYLVEQSCPASMQKYRGETLTVECQCRADQTQGGSLWGTDIYTDDSSLCRSAVHAGVLGQQGGKVIVKTLPGQTAYRGSKRFGIASSDYGAWQASYRFINPR